MKKKILSLLLAFAIVFSVFIPVNILPETKIVADAEEGSYPYNVYDSEVHVGSYEELETAVKNAIDNQMIILETDINKISDNPSYNYGNLDFTVNGTVAIDLNGCSINLGTGADYVFNIDGATKLHIMNSRIDENDSTISLKGKNEGRSVIQVADSSAELFVYEGIELVLEEKDGASTSGDPAVIRVKNVARLDLLCNIKALDAESNGIVFERLRLFNNHFANSKIYIRGHYDDSDVNTYIKADAACIKFVDVNPVYGDRTAFKVNADTFNIFKLGCNLLKTDASKKGAMISVGSSSTLTVNDICLAGGTFIPAGSSYLTGNITSFSDEDFYSIKYNSAELKTCPHNNTDEFKAEKLLSTPDSHIDMCKCKGATISSGHDRNSEMGCNGCELNTLDTEMTVPVVDEIIEVATYKELYNALRSNKSDITIRLTANITAYDGISGSVQSINLSVFGNVIIDLNGYYLDVNIAESKPLFVINKNYCNSEGALNLIITSFALGYNYILNRSSEVVHLNNENVSVTVYGADLSVSENASEGTSVIKATKFKNLNVFEDSRIINVVGSAISFDNSSSQAYENSSVDLSCCYFKTEKAAISLNGNPFKKNTFKKFSLGLSEFETFDYEGDKLQIFDCAVNPDVKWSDLIRHWVENEENRGYFLYGNNNKLISSAEDDANITKKFDYSVSVYTSSLDTSSLCSEAKNVAIIVNGNTVYAYCEICGQFGAHTVEAGAYESPNCTKEGKLEHFRCVDNNCGVYFNSEYMGVTAEDIILSKHSSTVLSDWRGLPQVFPECAATCTDPGLPEDCYFCFVCENYVSPDGRIVEEVPASHKLDFVKATVTCKHEGTIDHYHCSVCSKNFSDSEGKNELASIDCNPNLSFYHKFDSNPATEADCINYGIKYKHGICEHCDKLIVMIPGKFGTFSYEVFDEAKHTTPAGHSTVFVEAKSEDCTNDGNIEHYKCSACGKTFNEEAAINEISDVSIKAKHIISKIGAQKESCTVNGNIEHYKCTKCEKTFNDAAGKNEITDVTVKAPGHSYEWVVTKPAEIGVEGEKAYKCKVCADIKETQKLDALEPEYLIGDINDDGKWTSADARLTLRYSVELETFTETQKKAADTNGDSKITAADARKILRVSVELETF
ncbi:MAG: dockerin type I repeat-containing protein [Clostridia bacterium]|nr:dockerin type I repeat-containing protein [Clostridia bacterium]